MAGNYLARNVARAPVARIRPAGVSIWLQEPLESLKSKIDCK